MAYTKAGVDAARAAVLDQIAEGAAIVQYTIGGKTVTLDPTKALDALDRIERSIASSATGSSPFKRRSRVGFGRG